MKPKTELILSLSEHFSGKAGAQGAVPNAIFGSTEGNEMSRPGPPAGFFFLTFARQLLFLRE